MAVNSLGYFSQFYHIGTYADRRPAVKSPDRVPANRCWSALVMLQACWPICGRRPLGWRPSRRAWPVLIKSVAQNVDFMLYSATFWQKMAEFGTILHKKRGVKMGPFSKSRLRLG